VGAARRLAARSGAVAVLKGARSVIAAPGGEVWINPTGGPGLGTGGTGDVLAGLIGALFSQGLGALDAARLGAYLHGLAGDLGPASGGLAGEVAARIPAARVSLLETAGRDDGGRVLAFP
jgi:NAD(P)H-hydrate epimerase